MVSCCCMWVRSDAKWVAAFPMNRQAEDGEGFERVVSYHMRAYGLRRAKQVSNYSCMVARPVKC
jgi:hypothetical protein